MSRSLDFTACELPCKNPCWRRLTDEEKEWLANNPNRQAYTLQCLEKSKGFDLSKITASNLFEMEDDFMELEDE